MFLSVLTRNGPNLVQTFINSYKLSVNMINFIITHRAYPIFCLARLILSFMLMIAIMFEYVPHLAVHLSLIQTFLYSSLAAEIFLRYKSQDNYLQSCQNLSEVILLIVTISMFVICWFYQLEGMPADESGGTVLSILRLVRMTTANGLMAKKCRQARQISQACQHNFSMQQLDLN